MNLEIRCIQNLTFVIFLNNASSYILFEPFNVKIFERFTCIDAVF